MACLNTKNTVWKEAEERYVILDDVETHTFDVFVNWIYNDKNPVRHLHGAGQCPEHDWDLIFCGMIGAYALCDRLLMRTDLKGAINVPLVKYIMDHSATASWTAQHVRFAFNMLPERSLVLQLIADLECALRCAPDAEKAKQSFTKGSSKGELPEDFWMRVSKRDEDKERRARVDKWDYYESAK